jgi:hypothetical protein
VARTPAGAFQQERRRAVVVGRRDVEEGDGVGEELGAWPAHYCEHGGLKESGWVWCW